MKKHIFLLLMLILSLGGCSKSTKQPLCMSLDDIVFVNDFPEVLSLSEGIEINLEEELDIIGVRDFIIKDSLLIFTTKIAKGAWAFFNLSDYKNVGEFLQQGDGPFEFNQIPLVSTKAKFSQEDNTLYAYIYDFVKGYIYKMDIYESIETQTLQISQLDTTLPPFLFNIGMVDSSYYFCKEVNNNATGQLRYIYKNEEKIVNSKLNKLNTALINEGEDINLLSTNTKIHSSKKIAVEMPISLNYINIYSLDNSFGKTICTGNKLDDLEQIQKKDRWDRMYTYADLRVFESFWGVLRINETNKNYQIERSKLPSILIFDWKGDPKIKLQLEHHITSFDIDLINKNLYTYDSHTEEFFKYNIEQLLEKIL